MLVREDGKHVDVSKPFFLDTEICQGYSRRFEEDKRISDVLMII